MQPIIPTLLMFWSVSDRDRNVKNCTNNWLRFDEFLGRLPKVDLIILEGEKCPSVRPSTKSFFDLNEIWYIGRGR